MKKCIKCQATKPLSDYYNRSDYSDGKANICKVCDGSRRKSQYRTKDGIIKSIFSHQISSSKARSHNKPEYTFDELHAYLINNQIFNNLYNAYVASDFNQWKAPTVDRLDETKGYSFDNIQIVSFDENKRNHDEGRKTGKIITKQMIPILKYSKQGEFICEYPSIGMAARDVGHDGSHITRCAKGGRPTAGGYIWKFKEVSDDC
jgi:hypothetical protein